MGIAIAVQNTSEISTDLGLFARTAKAVECLRDSGVQFEAENVSQATTAREKGVRGSERSLRVLLASLLSKRHWRTDCDFGGNGFCPGFLSEKSSKSVGGKPLLDVVTKGSGVVCDG